ncbi:MAG TPA: hypothetical protein PK239_02760 [Chitinophagales bacterium]|nr:hypothetical protein [Chitinophagales bacterium]HRK26191.1 hypothetical protein [Chitinophagales bacterium]
MVSGLSTVWGGGYPSTLFPYNSSAVPIVSGNINTASYPSVFCLASVYGSGRAVALAHEGVFSNSEITQFNNVAFALNIFDWLDQPNTNQVAIASGHGEWLNFGNATTLKSQLQVNGYAVANISGTITAAALVGKGVLMIGNGWGTYSEAEKNAIFTYVQNGGGLLMLGLGWSWVAYNSGGLSAYPMNQIGQQFGFYWTDTGISDPTNQYNGQPLFTGFYPNTASLYTVAGACATLNNITGANAANLPTVLQTNTALRTDFINANLFMKETVKSLPANNPLRQEVFSCLETLINTYPALFRKGIAYNPTNQNNFIWIRERMHRTYADALSLTPALKTQIASTLGLTGQYKHIWTNFSVLLADNSSLDANQKDYLMLLFSAVQPELHNLRLMSFADEMGSPPVASYGAIPSFLVGNEGSVNSFSNTIGTYPENQFPPDVPPGISDVFCSAAPHELNHIVDAFFIEGNTALKNRKTQLIAQAGTDNLNYLRSMIPSGFFTENPQEFIASIANQYFIDTKKTLDLALIRFNNGRSEPLNQFLYFANLYANGLNHTRFYNTNATCVFSFTQVPVGRDANNRLNSLCYNNVNYQFTLNATGNVTAYTTNTCSACTTTPVITGNSQLCNNQISTYTTPLQPNTAYQWIVTEGIILSGQGTNTITVQWYDSAGGTVQVILLN